MCKCCIKSQNVRMLVLSCGTNLSDFRQPRSCPRQYMWLNRDSTVFVLGIALVYCPVRRICEVPRVPHHRATPVQSVREVASHLRLKASIASLRATEQHSQWSCKPGQTSTAPIATSRPNLRYYSLLHRPLTRTILLTCKVYRRAIF